VNSILIADRDHSVREVLADVTREAFPDATVQVAGSGDEVLEVLAKLSNPSAAVVHWAIAEERGAECMRRLREARVPVLLISAWDLSHTANALAPSEALLQKPFELHDYLAIVRQLLAQGPPR